MRTSFGLHAACGLTAIVLLCAATALGQGTTHVPFGTLPTQNPPAATTTVSTGTSSGGSSSFGQPPWLAQSTVPAFPGSVLFNQNPPFLCGVKVNRSDLSYREGDTLTVEFTAEREAYLYLIYHQANGESVLLYPNEAHIVSRVPARQWVTIPPPGEDFRFRVTAPFGTEVLQVLASLKPVDELDGLVKRIGRAAPVSQQVINTLHGRLKQDLTNWAEYRLPITTRAKTEQVPTHKATRVGLFVGVNRFQVEKEGERDKNVRFRLGAELMANTMLQRGQLNPDLTKTLTDQQATRENIEAAITRWLPSVTKPGDTVFIFYAGHGGLVKNLDGTKTDGKDGVLTTYNNAFAGGKLTHDQWDEQARANFITDNTLARWLQELPGRQIALIISSCHAGSMIDAKLLAKFASREATRVKGISEMNVVVLASCLPDESTLSNLDKPVWLANDLAEAMAKLSAPVTLQRAFDYYRNAHHQRLAKQGDTGYHEPVLTDTALLPIVLVP